MNKENGEVILEAQALFTVCRCGSAVTFICIVANPNPTYGSPANPRGRNEGGEGRNDLPELGREGARGHTGGCTVCLGKQHTGGETNTVFLHQSTVLVPKHNGTCHSTGRQWGQWQWD